jgi:hypothetical protein
MERAHKAQRNHEKRERRRQRRRAKIAARLSQNRGVSVAALEQRVIRKAKERHDATPEIKSPAAAFQRAGSAAAQSHSFVA